MTRTLRTFLRDLQWLRKYTVSVLRGLSFTVQLRTDEARVNFSRNQSITRENIKLTVQFSAEFPLLHCELFLLCEILQLGIDEKEWHTSTCQELCARSYVTFSDWGNILLQFWEDDQSSAAVRNMEARVNFSRNQLITSENIQFILKFSAEFLLLHFNSVRLSEIFSRSLARTPLRLLEIRSPTRILWASLLLLYC